MIILSLYEVHNASAALSVNGEIIGAELEERITGKKNQMGLPIKAAISLLERFSIKSSQIDHVYVLNRSFDLNGIANLALSRMSDYTVKDWHTENERYWYPKLIEKKEVEPSYFSIMCKYLENDPWAGHSTKYLYTDELTEYLKNHDSKKAAELFNLSRKDLISRNLFIDSSKIHFIEHYITHHYHAFYSSPEITSNHENALIVHAEGDGGLYNHAVSKFSTNSGINILKGTNKFGLGRLYQWMTLYLKMKPYAHEYKMMGLAPFSEHLIDDRCINDLNSYFKTDESGLITNNKIPDDYFYTFSNIFSYTRFDVVSSSIQKIVEDNLVRAFTSLSRVHNTTHFYYGGGVAMNVKANMSIYKANQVDSLAVPFAPADEGNVLGACYYGYEKHQLSSNKKVSLSHKGLVTPYLGTNMVKDTSIERLSNDFAIFDIGEQTEKICELLLNGYIGAIAKGAYEFGQRALGNRSIIGLPSTKGVVHKINTAIKMRDFWMPFAPSITNIDADRVLINYNSNCPYMSSSCEVKPEYYDLMEGALHSADKTCRPHIVSQESNPWYFNLLNEVKNKCGLGCLVNTSFNIHNKPIVNTYSEAIHIFQNSGLNFLVLDNHLIVKK